MNVYFVITVHLRIDNQVKNIRKKQTTNKNSNENINRKKNMQTPYEMENPEAVDPIEHVHQQEVLDEKRDEFMRKYLKRSWPIRVLRIVCVIQLLVALAILGVDLPIILMFAPRWQIFAGIWTFIFAFIACVGTLHSSRLRG